MSVPLAQLFIATAQSQFQLVLQFVKVPKFPLNVGQFFLAAGAVPVRKAASDSLAAAKSPRISLSLNPRPCTRRTKSQRFYVVLDVSSKPPSVLGGLGSKPLRS